MADLYTEQLGPASRISEPLARRSRNDPGPGHGAARQHQLLEITHLRMTSGWKTRKLRIIGWTVWLEPEWPVA